MIPSVLVINGLRDHRRDGRRGVRHRDYLTLNLIGRMARVVFATFANNYSQFVVSHANLASSPQQWHQTCERRYRPKVAIQATRAAGGRLGFGGAGITLTGGGATGAGGGSAHPQQLAAQGFHHFDTSVGHPVRRIPAWHAVKRIVGFPVDPRLEPSRETPTNNPRLRE